jgi:hypothetical protein
MASGDTTATVQCPECKEPVTFSVRLRHRSNTEVAVSVDLAPVHDHIASHQPQVTTEPPVTVRLDNRDARFTPTQPVQDHYLPVQCWHTEAGTPCDSDVCRQPDRLADGDTGTDPTTRQ